MAGEQAPASQLGSVDQVQQALAATGYLADRPLATACFLSLRLQRPLLLEGEAGVGKTECAKALALVLGAPLVRLQCYEGIDVHQALYEWNHPRQLLAIRQQEIAGGEVDVFSETFLIRRPLLQALGGDGATPVLLIDELDRSDDEFEAFLLELLSDWQVTIPELGTITAASPPVVVCTSNRTRELHDALKRRCLYHWIDYPSPEVELAIVRSRLPEVSGELARQAVSFVQQLRQTDLYKLPGVAETLDWSQALAALGQQVLTPEVVDETLGSLLKYQEDLALVRELGTDELLARSSGRA